MGKAGFAQSRRTAQQHVVEDIAPLFGSFHPHREQLHHLLLPLEFRKNRWAEGNIKGRNRSLHCLMIKLIAALGHC